MILRTAKGLVAARIPTRRIRLALRRLRAQLPRGRSLAELRIAADGDRIVVSDGEATWSVDSGQTQLDFAVSDLASRAAPIARRTAFRARLNISAWLAFADASTRALLRWNSSRTTSGMSSSTSPRSTSSPRTGPGLRITATEGDGGRDGGHGRHADAQEKAHAHVDQPSTRRPRRFLPEATYR